MYQRKIHEKDNVEIHLLFAIKKISLLEKEMAIANKSLELTKEKNIVLEKNLSMHENTILKSTKTINDKFDKHVKCSNERLATLEKQTMDIMKSFEEALKTHE